MESQNLWEMTGDSYKKLVNQNLFTSYPTVPFAQPKPQVPLFPTDLSS